MRIVGWNRDASWRITRITAPDGRIWFETGSVSPQQDGWRNAALANLRQSGCITDQVPPPIVEGDFFFLTANGIAEAGGTDPLQRLMTLSPQAVMTIRGGIGDGTIETRGRAFHARLGFNKVGYAITAGLHTGPVPHPVAGEAVIAEEDAPDLTDFVAGMGRR